LGGAGTGGGLELDPEPGLESRKEQDERVTMERTNE